MTMKLLLAKPAEGREGAKITLKFWEAPTNPHTLKLHQDDKGVWWPALEVFVNGCQSKDVQQVRVRIAEVLRNAADVLQSTDFKDLPAIASMVSCREG